MPAVDDVFAFLANQNIAGGATGWSLLRRKIMDGTGVNDQLVVVSEDGGSTPEIHAASGMGDSALADPGVIVTVRAKKDESDASLTKANEVLAALHGRLSQTLVSSGTVYFRVRAQTAEPVFAGYDDQGRPMHTIAFRLLKLA